MIASAIMPAVDRATPACPVCIEALQHGHFIQSPVGCSRSITGGSWAIRHFNDERLVDADPYAVDWLAVIVENELPAVGVEEDRARDAVNEGNGVNSSVIHGES
jgi:hypothetical protein